MSRLLDACSRSCYCCLKALYWLPVVFVFAILLWAYYVYVYVLNLSGQFTKPVPVIFVFLAVAHMLLCLHLSSYFRTIFTQHKQIPPNYLLTDEQLDMMEEMEDTQSFLSEVAANLPVHQVTRSNTVRYCNHCELIKPDRSHHCSTCGRCILKMDHHCPWVNNCVGYSNYKYFFLFLFYTVVLCLWFCLSSLYDLIHLWKSSSFKDALANKFNVTFCFIIIAVFSFSTGSLFLYHLYLVIVNKTTIESMDAPRTSRGQVRGLFHIGVRRNLRSVFGKNILLAFLPIDTSEGNGASFPIKGQHSLNHVEYRSHSRRLQPHNSNNNNTHNNITAAFAVSASESEVEIFAVDEKKTETVPLTQ